MIARYLEDDAEYLVEVISDKVDEETSLRHVQFRVIGVVHHSRIFRHLAIDEVLNVNHSTKHTQNSMQTWELHPVEPEAVRARPN